MSKNIYCDMEYAWAEYEYIRVQIKNHIWEILKDDPIIQKDYNNSIDIEIENAMVIISFVNIGLSISTLLKLKTYLGIDGKIVLSGTKKNHKMEVIFEKNSDE